MTEIKSKPKQALIDFVVNNSIVKTWELALPEWDYISFFEANDTDRITECVCGKKNIKKLSTVRNRNTKVEGIIGSCCIKRFMGYRSDLVFNGFENVLAEGNANKSTIDFLMSINVLTHTEAIKYLEYTRKGNWDKLQYHVVNRINTTILKYWIKINPHKMISLQKEQRARLITLFTELLQHTNPQIGLKLNVEPLDEFLQVNWMESNFQSSYKEYYHLPTDVIEYIKATWSRFETDFFDSSICVYTCNTPVDDLLTILKNN